MYKVINLTKTACRFLNSKVLLWGIYCILLSLTRGQKFALCLILDEVITFLKTKDRQESKNPKLQCTRMKLLTQPAALETNRGMVRFTYTDVPGSEKAYAFRI